MKYNRFRPSLFSALAALSVFATCQLRADSTVSIAIAPATGAVTVVPRWGIGGSLAGFHHMAQDLSLGGGANQFYSIKGTTIPSGGDSAAFTRYIAASGAATDHADIGSKLTPNSYSALTSADPDVGFGSVNFYLIHHKATGDYFTVIKPSSGTASSVTDLKPMNGPGGPATGSAPGYFGLTFAAVDLNYGANLFYYFRTDPGTGFTKFGTLVPALLATSADQFDLGLGGHNALAFTGTDVGYGVNKMYYLRLDPITGFSILGLLQPGTLDPTNRRTADIANLGSVYSTMTFVPGDVGFGTNKFYTAGAVNATWQSVSFAAIADRLISAGSFTVTPSASSGLPIALTVVSSSLGAASISGPVAGVFTVTPTAPGLITLQATQAGQAGTFEFNMLRQSFTATGAATLAITSQPTPQSSLPGSTANFTVTASGTTALSYQWRKAGINISGNASAVTSTLTLTNVQAADAANYDVVVTNASGSIISNSVVLTVATAAPAITNSPLTAPAMVGTPFSFTITATNSPTSYSASPLPPGILFNTATGAFTGTPTVAGTTDVLLNAINPSGTGSTTLRITVAAAASNPPIFINSPVTAAATVGAPFNFSITASGSPTSYSASPLPPGIVFNTATGVFSGSPTTAGTTDVLLGATNATVTGSSTLRITVAGASVSPVITNFPLTAAGTVGTPFSTYTIVATGLPTSYGATNLAPGLVVDSSTGAITGTPTQAATTFVTLAATNSAGTGTASLMIVIGAAAGAPIISSPASAPATVGAPFATYFIVATGSPTSYTATGLPAGLTLDPLTGAINGIPTTAGTFVVTIQATNSAGTTSSTVTINVAAPPVTSSRIVNFSARALSGPGDQTLITGFVVAGNGKNLLVRGIGPGLTRFGVVNALVDPMLTLFGAGGIVAANDDWQSTASGQMDGPGIAALAARVGAFALPNGSKDSALASTFNNGAHTTSMVRPNSTTGVALTEIYDTDATAGARLINVSARMNVTVGEGTLIAGFVIAGNGPTTVLIRGVGPTLSAFAVTGVLVDPTIAVYAGATQFATNDNWGAGASTAAQITAASAQVGAFALVPGSRDAALLLTLQPGTYTVQVTGVGGTTGVALLEIYEAL
ncbi:MAG: putative Ig domain-containing protein [Opitutaceae bacterium]|nr:putative Ig domain-containing protein [Opitutaceae bacterium]